MARDIGLVCLADTLVGASFGAIAVGGDLPLWLPMALSVIVFAGAATLDPAAARDRARRPQTTARRMG